MSLILPSPLRDSLHAQVSMICSDESELLEEMGRKKVKLDMRTSPPLVAILPSELMPTVAQKAYPPRKMDRARSDRTSWLAEDGRL
jgi:hypothetical protein